MISEVTKYVFGSVELTTDDNFSLKLNIITEFLHEPRVKEIKQTCIKWANENYPDYKWTGCFIFNLEFLSKDAYDKLKDIDD